jgi:hypothetical protein
MPESAKKRVEVRAFGHISRVFEKRGFPVPLLFDVDEPIMGTALARKLELPRGKIEVIIVTGYVQSLSHVIQPEDRLAFVPWGNAQSLPDSSLIYPQKQRMIAAGT